jgi:ABC-2 type transport system permease protein
VLGAGVFLASIAVLALAVGTLCRTTAAGITAAVGLIFVAPNATGFIPGQVGRYISTYLPGGQAGQRILSTGHDSGSVLGPWAGLLVALAWTAVALGLAVLAVRRRDV